MRFKLFGRAVAAPAVTGLALLQGGTALAQGAIDNSALSLDERSVSTSAPSGLSTRCRRR